VVAVDVVSTVCFLKYLKSISRMLEPKQHLSTSAESTRIIASMGVIICSASIFSTVFYSSAAFSTDVFLIEWLKLVMGCSIMFLGILWMLMKIRLDTRNVNTKTATPSATSIPSAPSGQKSDKTPKKSIGSTEERANEAITQV
jgi:hypothetical protein